MTEIQNLQAMGAQRMTSLEIAEITGKQHKNLMRDIRNMEAAWEKTCGLKFELTSRTISQPNGGTRIVPYYSLNKMECIRHLLVTDQDVMHEAERIVGRELTCDNKHADGCITITDIAKVFGMETKELNSFLKDQGVQRWSRGQFRLTENYEGRGLAQDRLFVYYGKDGKMKRSTYLVWTTKGAEMIEEMINPKKNKKLQTN